jgi:acetyl-CoA carboxylase carboxyltransferase component
MRFKRGEMSGEGDGKLSHEDKLDLLRKKREEAKVGGGPKRIERQHSSGKLTARERLDLLLDPGSFSEVGMFVTPQPTSFGELEKKFYGDGVVTGSGLIDGRRVYVFAQDFTVIGGSLGEHHARKICLVMEKGIQTGSPIIGLIDSGGARIQEGLGHYGSIFYRNTLAAGVIPQVSVILGPCAGGAVYSPALSDFVFMAEGISRMHITGPQVIKAVTGEQVTPEELGGAAVHHTRSGVAHFVSKGEKECLGLVRELLSYLPSNNWELPPIRSTGDPIDRMEDDLEDIIPDDPKKPYDMKELIRLVVDDGIFLEIQEGFARNSMGTPLGLSPINPLFLPVVSTSIPRTRLPDLFGSVTPLGFPLSTSWTAPGISPGPNRNMGESFATAQRCCMPIARPRCLVSRWLPGRSMAEPCRGCRLANWSVPT